MSRASKAPVLLVGLLALWACELTGAQRSKEEPWKLGRATFYGKDGWSIHTGSCGYGYMDENAGTGWDVAAASDSNKDWKDSCGTCKEVRCKEMWFKDGYGQKLERETICYDPAASLVVTITDTCPCIYPGNYYSNKRWCCGDMYHLDLSLWSFEKLADTRYGVIAIEWRDVPCSYRPVKRAKNPFNRRSTGERSAPRGWRASFDRRPYNAYSEPAAQGRRLRGAASV
ncbi:RlpA-like double-psi beta-barrel-protein domain-containing protein-containing protein [Scenedesmus sp. NREL 46B-D3]|nr:RlpA-like double-psi beta-barrel-protein domain-containing protein-containing protein [Scenedesmus sp. NREL 46B-D3]